MEKLIKTFSDGSVLEYDRGRFDDWCVYLTRPNVSKHAPLDTQYFQRLLNIGEKYGKQQVYNDFVDIYSKTGKVREASVLEHISNLAKKYNADAIDVEVDFTILYAGMIAEENKVFTKLGKRVKRLGMYQVLIEGMQPSVAANYSKGKKWPEIASWCEERGF